MTLARTLAIARKEALQLRRDPRSLTLGFLIPPLLIVFFGYAITSDVDDIHDNAARALELTMASWIPFAAS